MKDFDGRWFTFDCDNSIFECILQPISQDYNLAFHNTYVVCVIILWKFTLIVRYNTHAHWIWRPIINLCLFLDFLMHAWLISSLFEVFQQKFWSFRSHLIWEESLHTRCSQKITVIFKFGELCMFDFRIFFSVMLVYMSVWYVGLQVWFGVLFDYFVIRKNGSRKQY